MNGTLKSDGHAKVRWSKTLKYNGSPAVAKEGWYDTFKSDSCN